MDGHLRDTQLGTGDLRVDGDTALADLRHGRVDHRDGLAVDDLEAHAGGRVVVEALGEADVLDADRVADAADDALTVGGVRETTGQRADVRALAGRLPLALRRQRTGLDPAQQLGDRRRGVHDLAGGHDRALLHGVQLAELDRVHAQLRRELVHLGLVGEAGLDGAEAAHRATGRVVRVERDRLDVHVLQDVGTHREGGGVAHDRRGGRRVRAAVQDDLALHVRELAVLGGAVLVVELRRVAVHVAEERLEPVVDDLDRLVRGQGQEAGVDLHRDVLAATEGTADARERHTDLLRREAEDRGDLLEVRVQPLGGDVQLDAAVLGRHGQAGLRAEEGLVLHAEGVLALDDDVGALAGLFHVAADDRLAVHDVRVRDVTDVVVVAALVDQRRVGGEGGGLVGDERKLAVVDLDLGGRSAGGLRVVGGHEGDRLTVVTYPAVGENRGVLDLQAVVLHLGRQVVVRQHRVHAGHGERLGDVDGDDLGVGDGAAQRLAPEHVLVPHVRGVRELAGDLEGAVRAKNRFADAALVVLLGDVRRRTGGHGAGVLRHGQTASP